MVDDLGSPKVDCVNTDFEITNHRSVAMTVVRLCGEEEDVGTRAAADVIERSAAGGNEIVAAPAVQPVAAASATQGVGTSAAFDSVDPGLADDYVVAATAVEA